MWTNLINRCMRIFLIMRANPWQSAYLPSSGPHSHFSHTQEMKKEKEENIKSAQDSLPVKKWPFCALSCMFDGSYENNMTKTKKRHLSKITRSPLTSLPASPDGTEASSNLFLLINHQNPKDLNYSRANSNFRLPKSHTNRQTIIHEISIRETTEGPPS